MPARGEVETHERVARLQQREEHRLVRLAAGIRLHIGELAVDKLLDALDRQRLDDIDKFAAAIIAPARIALGIFVGQDRTLRLKHGLRDDVLGGDQLDLVLLTAKLLVDRGRDLGIDLINGAAKKGLWSEWARASASERVISDILKDD